LLDEDFTDVFNPEWIGVDPTSDDVAAAYFLYHDCDYANLRWALREGRLWYPSALYSEPALGSDIPATVIVAERDRTLRPDWSRKAARERLRVMPIEVSAGHCPHISMPEEMADLLGSAIP
jgi:pimeloyl-ACP methyl ester carboxylesterase